MAPESLELLLSSKPLASIFCRVPTTQGFSSDLCLHTQSIFLQLLGLFIKFPTANPSILSIYSTEHNKYISAKSMPHPAHKRIQRSEYWAGEMVESPLELYSTSKEHPLSTAYQLSLSNFSPVFPLTDIEMTFCFFHFLCHVYLIIQLQ